MGTDDHRSRHPLTQMDDQPKLSRIFAYFRGQKMNAKDRFEAAAFLPRRFGGFLSGFWRRLFAAPFTPRADDLCRQ